jgi:hypothetical protein
MDRDIQTVEALRWSWRKALKGAQNGGIGGLIFGLLLELLIWVFSVLNAGDVWGGLIELLQVELVFGLTGSIIGTILNGLHHEITETKSIPNQGIWLSIRNSFLSGSIFGVLGLSSGIFMTWKWGFMIGSFSGLAGLLWYGGFEIIKHYTLRTILIVQGYTPASYARFLDYAVDRIFLQKVGGGYRFIHRLLLEHFADMETAQPQISSWDR